MSLRLKTVLGQLAGKGITPNDLAPDEIEMLVFAVDRANNPYRRLDARLCGRPVEVSDGLYLWPITAGAQVWLTDHAERWWKRGTSMHFWATVYALHNARNAEAFVRLDTPGVARFAVTRTMLKFCCHQAELADAVARCYGVDPHDAPKRKRPPKRPKEQAVGFARYCAQLEAGTGIKAEDWLWGRSLDETIDAWGEMRRLARAAYGKRHAEADAELDAALENLAAAISCICKAHGKD